ncbi:MAG: nucleotide pyrophosphohydrolase [Gammaproteobacteria bacterium]|nr:nucleotide pyrophosphohydrolase [Gammaproteobacteria bacterium]
MPELNKLGQEINEINRANGWNVIQPKQWEDPYKIPALLALITSETSEALEAFRKNDKLNFAEECADQIIRVLDLTAGLGIDIDAEVRRKLEKNKQRGYRHGGKRV